MKAALDVHYLEDEQKAFAACIVFEDFCSAAPSEETRVEIQSIEPYKAGEFYRRELPCLIAALDQITTEIDGIIVDSYVDLPDNRPGMGRYLFTALSKRIPIIGVAKNQFSGTTANMARPLLRGNSQRPLYISAAGMELETACQAIEKMHGDYRFPTLLRYVDQLARGTLPD